MDRLKPFRPRPTGQRSARPARIIAPVFFAILGPGIALLFGACDRLPFRDAIDDMQYEKYRTAAPAVSEPDSATLDRDLSLTLSSATQGATIYYTLDGSAPVSSGLPTANAMKYSGLIALKGDYTAPKTWTLKSAAVKEGLHDSEVTTASWTITYGWHEVTPTGTCWSAREDFQLVSTAGKLWVIGGAPNGYTLNDLWSSADGLSWTPVFPDKALGSYPAREFFASAVAGSDIVVLGGDQRSGIAAPTIVTDVSSYNPVSDDVWNHVSDLPVQLRHGTAAVTPDGRLWHLGGLDPSQAVNSTYYYESGAWETGSTLPSVVCDATALLSEDGTLWLFGGGGSNGIPLPNLAVWLAGDGWHTQSATPAEAITRLGHAALSFAGKLWLMGGTKSSSVQYSNDVWYSADGATWTCLTAAAPWPARRYFGAAVHDDRIWVMGGATEGSLEDDIWYYGPEY